MVNGAIAAAFERIADLLEISGESAFRVNSYRRVARFLKSHTRDIAEEAAENRLLNLPGIGQSTADKINEYLATSRMTLLTELESKLPTGLPDLLGISSMGPKKIALVHNRLGVGSMDDLKRVIASGELAELAGFGDQSVKKISDGIAFLERSGGRTPLGVAMPIAEEMAAAIEKLAGVRRVAMAGSLRRGVETIGDVDLLCECDDPKNAERIIKSFTEHPSVQGVLVRGGTKGSVIVNAGRELQVDLRVVPRESFGAALQYFTGSKEHNVRLRELAVKRKWRLNEYGLYDGERAIAGKTEESIYKKLGLPVIPPELREDGGEFDLTEAPELVTESDIRGDLHMHTTASDGKCSIDEMAAAAKARGYAYIAITDHSKSSTIANGLSIDRMTRHIEAIREADKRIKGIRILVGCECDILRDGAMDYPDEILAECDVVVASIHSAMGEGSKSGETPTHRLLKAIENRYVTIIGHATGRLLGKRPAMTIDIDQVARAAADSGTALEINASWQRLDLKASHVRQAIDAGAMLTIDTDAHHTDSLGLIRYGLATARRGWAKADNVLNTRSFKGVTTWIAKKRR